MKLKQKWKGEIVSLLVTAKQLTAIARFNREYNVKEIELSSENGKLEVIATVHAGKELKKKGFYLNEEGGLAGVIKNEDSQT